ncbi:HAD family hydrolase [Bordetella sp. FB-8]|uniref:HAD family hydrolase n=1 Tax=Bordetella sp. FB-8 TaxID=1159870 RepID=UPI0003616726|nr:HAD family hydrolase [Bordetella sp. FB-8]
MPLRHIVFDLDGTLIDSAPAILGTLASILEQAGLEPVRPLTQDIIGPPLAEIVASLVPVEKAALIPVLIAAFKNQYDGHGYKETLSYPGVSIMLESLVKMNFSLFIATNKRIYPTRLIVNHLEWDGLFSGAYALDSFDPPFTGKAGLLSRLRNQLGLDKSSSIYVGDRPEDAAAAAHADLPFIQAAWGYGSGWGKIRLDTPWQLIEEIKPI